MKTIHVIITILLLVTVQVTTLLWLGNPILCNCESLKFWDGAPRSVENSQHIFDWYSFSHFVSGFLLYFVLSLTRRKFGWPKLAVAFLIVILVSLGWEIFENTHFAIERFQVNTISLDYYGDSVPNALMDTVAMAGGFWLAFYLPTWMSIVLVIAIEAAMISMTRDGLLLHGLMFAYPIKSIFNWQASLTK